MSHKCIYWIYWFSFTLIFTWNTSMWTEKEPNISCTNKSNFPQPLTFIDSWDVHLTASGHLYKWHKVRQIWAHPCSEAVHIKPSCKSMNCGNFEHKMSSGDMVIQDCQNCTVLPVVLCSWITAHEQWRGLDITAVYKQSIWVDLFVV